MERRFIFLTSYLQRTVLSTVASYQAQMETVKIPNSLLVKSDQEEDKGEQSDGDSEQDNELSDSD